MVERIKQKEAKTGQKKNAPSLALNLVRLAVIKTSVTKVKPYV
jgi:hypothetical protein